MKRPCWKSWLLRPAILLVIAPAIHAQSDDFVQSGVQFNFSTPGARSLALGGAFIALADDATAAFANPAGLVNLSKPEISVEGRNTSFSRPFVVDGHLATPDASGGPFDPPTGMGIDTAEGLRFGSSEEDTTGLSFLSYVQPIGNLRIAIYRQELANYEARSETQGAFFAFSGPNLGRNLPSRAEMDVEIENIGLSLAYQVSDQVAIGLGLSYYDFELLSVTQRFDFIGNPFGPADFSSPNLFYTQVSRGDDHDLAVNAGVLWRLSPSVGLGAVYRRAPDFDFDTTVTCGPSDPAFCQALFELTTSSPFNVPDVWGLGIAFSPKKAGGNLKLVMDYDRIHYSDLAKDIAVPLGGVETDQPAAGGGVDGGDFALDDGNEYHLGGEYRVSRGGAGIGRPAVFLRAGIWHEPKNQVRYANRTGGDFASQDVRVRWAASDRVDDMLHYAGGVGFGFRSVTIDVGFDLSDRIDTFSLSVVAALDRRR